MKIFAILAWIKFFSELLRKTSFQSLQSEGYSCSLLLKVSLCMVDQGQAPCWIFLSQIHFITSTTQWHALLKSWMMYMQPLVIYINMEGMLQFLLDHIYAHISYTVLHLFCSLLQRAHWLHHYKWQWSCGNFSTPSGQVECFDCLGSFGIEVLWLFNPQSFKFWNGITNLRKKKQTVTSRALDFMLLI